MNLPYQYLQAFNVVSHHLPNSKVKIVQALIGFPQFEVLKGTLNGGSAKLAVIEKRIKILGS